MADRLDAGAVVTLDSAPGPYDLLVAEASSTTIGVPADGGPSAAARPRWPYRRTPRYPSA